MRDYLLFIDTETSGLPKDWKKPYSASGNWPYVVQVAWVVCSREGRELKSENHYIGNDDFDISAASARVHGISSDFLRTHGKPRKQVMQLLLQDLQQYQPLVVGHYMHLDFHMLGACFYRAGLENPLTALPTFCTMKFSGRYVRLPFRKYLKLSELHHLLFHEPLQRQHDALSDASATARCFFALVEKGELDEAAVSRQQEPADQVRAAGQKTTCFLLLLGILLLLLLALYLR